MSYFFDLLLWVHIAAGMIGLIVFWVPIFSKKGSKNHLQFGKYYVRLMWVVVVTAVVLCIKNLFTVHYNTAIFLGFIALLTASPLWSGIRILQDKKEASPGYLRTRQLFDASLVLTGAALLTYGLYLKLEGVGILMVIFGILGLSSTPDLIRGFKTKRKTNWLYEHLAGMIGSGIASHTAFLVFGAANFLGGYLPGSLMVIPWVTPAIVGAIGTSYARKKWTKKKR